MAGTGFQPKREADVRGKGDYEGFEAVVSLRMPIGRVGEFQANLESGDPERVSAALRFFGDTLLRSWNLLDERTGEPVPADGEGLLTQDNDFAMALIASWSEALVAPPLTSSGQPTPSVTPESEASPPNGNITNLSEIFASSGAAFPA